MPPSFSKEKDKQHDPVGVLVAFVVFIRHRFWAQMSLEWESFRCRIYQNFAPMVGFVWPLTLPFCYKISGPLPAAAPWLLTPTTQATLSTTACLASHYLVILCS